MKTIKKKNMSEADLKVTMEEISILKELDHPNIVKYYESYIDNETNINFLVMQFIDGFKLFDKIQK